MYQAASTCGGKEEEGVCSAVQAHLGHSPGPPAFYCHQGSQQAPEVVFNPDWYQLLLGGSSLQKQYSTGNESVKKLAPARKAKKTKQLIAPKRMELQLSLQSFHPPFHMFHIYPYPPVC